MKYIAAANIIIPIMKNHRAVFVFLAGTDDKPDDRRTNGSRNVELLNTSRHRTESE